MITALQYASRPDCTDAADTARSRWLLKPLLRSLNWQQASSKYNRSAARADLFVVY